MNTDMLKKLSKSLKPSVYRAKSKLRLDKPNSHKTDTKPTVTNSVLTYFETVILVVSTLFSALLTQSGMNDKVHNAVPNVKTLG